MTRLVWEEQEYATGLDRGVFYPNNGPAEAWNGLVSVTDRPDILRNLVRHRDGIKIATKRMSDSFAADVIAYTYPSSFYDGVLKSRQKQNFGFSYRAKTSMGYYTHLVYNITAQMTQRTYEHQEVDPFEWLFTTVPEAVPYAFPTAHLIIDENRSYEQSVLAIQDVLYGSDAYSPRLLSPQEVFDLYDVNAVLQVVDHGDGTFSITGPDHLVQMTDATTFVVHSPSATYLDEATYTIRSI